MANLKLDSRWSHGAVSAFQLFINILQFGLRHGNVSRQIQLYWFSSCRVFCCWSIAIHCKKFAGLGIFMNRCRPFGGHWRIGRAQLHCCGVLHGMFTGFNFKGCVPRFDESNIGPRLGFPWAMGGWPSAADTASPKESECHHQKDGANDNGGVAYRQKCPKSKGSHQGDVDTCKHDAQSTGTAQSWGRQSLWPCLFLTWFLGQSSVIFFIEHDAQCLQGCPALCRTNMGSTRCPCCEFLWNKKTQISMWTTCSFI